MNPIPVTVTTKSIPANYQVPNDMQGVLEAIAKYTDYEADCSGPAIVVSASGAETEPGTGQQVGADLNSIWVQILGPGFTLAPRVRTGFYNDWWPVYTGQLGEVRAYCGPIAPYFDTSGLGVQWNGWEGWALCDGRNNTPNLHNHFIIPGYRYDATLGWTTNVSTLLDTGKPWPRITTDPTWNTSALTVGLAAYSQPVDTHSGGIPSFAIYTWNLGSGNPSPFNGVNVDVNAKYNWHSTEPVLTPTGGRSGLAFQGQVGENTVGTWTYPLDQSYVMKHAAISRIPPYVALGFIQFIGYSGFAIKGPISP